MRVSIKAHHKQYLELISAQMGCDVAEALNYLIFEIRKTGYSFSSGLLPVSAPTSTPVHSARVEAIEPPQSPQPLQPIGIFTPYQEVKPAPVSTPMAEDPLIARLVSAGLEQF